MPRRILSISILILACSSISSGAELFYGFDDGSFQGWDYIKPDGSEIDLSAVSNGWAPWADPIDIGDGFSLVPATSGDFRIVPFPWDTRDCLSGLECTTQIMRSPEFFLDFSGDVSVDMIGGQLRGNTTAVAEEDFPAEVGDLPEFRSSDPGIAASQGFALRDAITDEYILFGFSDVENDGKMRDDDPTSRGEWQTVSIPVEELAQFADQDTAYTIDIYDSYLGGWGWIGFDSVRIPGTLVDEPPGVPCDFNNDQICTLDDLNDLMYVGLGGNDTKYDLDSNGTIDLADRDVWLRQTDSLPGDADLNGVVNANDLNSLGTNWQKSDISSWSDGDFNGDGLVTAADLNPLGVWWTKTAADFSGGAAAANAAVPEPTSLVTSLFGLLALIGLRRRS